MLKNGNYCNIKTAANELNVTPREIYRVLREGILERKDNYEEIMISLRSLRKYRVNRHQKTPDGYISIKEAADSLGVKECVVQNAIDRKELQTREFRRSLIIELESFWLWVKFLVDSGVFTLKTNKVLKGSIKIKNSKGLHTRPAGKIYEICKKYFHEGTKLVLKKDGVEACGESLTDLLALKASLGSRLKYRIEGDLCEDLLVEIKNLFNNLDKCDNKPNSEYKYDLMAAARDIRMSKT